MVQHTAIQKTKHKWHKACRRLAWWIYQTKRPLALVNGHSFKELCSDISSPNFQSCCLQMITTHILEMSAMGWNEVRRRFPLLAKAKVQLLIFGLIPPLV